MDMLDILKAFSRRNFLERTDAGQETRNRAQGLSVDIVIFNGEIESGPRNLEVLLAQDMPDARILSINLKLDALSGTPREVVEVAHGALFDLIELRQIDEELRRPILFIGQSLGGIILKEVIFLAGAIEKYQSIKACIRGIVFLGTPHREDETRSYAQILSNISDSIGSEGFNRISNCLSANNEHFRRLTTSWNLLPNYPVYTFSETKLKTWYERVLRVGTIMPKAGQRVLVNRQSATLGADHEVHTCLPTSHKGLLRSPKTRDKAYRVFYKALQQLKWQAISLGIPKLQEERPPQPLQLLSGVLPYRCPICSSIRLDNLSVGPDAQSLEFEINLSSSAQSNLRAWRNCALAGFARRISLTWLGDEIHPDMFSNPSVVKLCHPHPPWDNKYDNNYELSTEHDVPFSEHVLNVVVHADPLSNPSFRQLKRWIDTCDKDHECSKTSTASLPTRVLDIRDLNHIKIVETADMQKRGQDYRYATLSHCWGSSRKFLTTKQNILGMKRGFCLSEEVPKTFQDAMIVAHRLGIPYLWIDTLCIIQDNLSDWDAEASNMAKVYTNSYLTIAALNSDDDARGFLHPRPFPYTTVKLKSPNGESAVAYISEVSKKFIYTGPEEWPLLTRGWVLQEQLLSPRILSFSKDQIVWECKKEVIAESKNVIRPPYSNSSILTGTLNWRNVVAEFSKRVLTYDTDKLPAMAGIASAFSRSIHGRYCAGLWMYNLPHDLIFAWRTPIIPSEYLAPSWSWAAMNGPVKWKLFNSFSSTYPLDTICVVDSDMKMDTDNPYGRVKKGSSLTIRVHLAVMRTCMGSKRHVERDPIFNFEFAYGHHRGRNVSCWFDIPQVQPDEVVGCMIAYESDYGKRVWTALRGILLAPMEGYLDSYKRVGYFIVLGLEGNEGVEIINDHPPKDIVLY